MRNRIISFILAAVMLTTFSLPASATEIMPVQNVIDMTHMAESVPEPDNLPPEQAKTGGTPENVSPARTEIPPHEDVNAATYGADTNREETAATPADTETGNFTLNCTPEQAAKLIAFYEYIGRQISVQPGIQLFSAPGDSGTVTWTWGEAVGIDVPSGDSDNPYHIGNIPRITLNTSNPPAGRPFCVDFGVDPGGSYTASEGGDSRILSLLVAYQKGQASAVGVQLALWYIVNGLPLSTQSQAAAALSAASGVNTTGYTYYLWDSGSGQPFVTLDRTEDAAEPDPDEPGPDEPQNPNTRTEVETQTSTRTEIRSSSTYEYADAIGQITVAKRDNEGKSLDGAIFNIQIRFANGQTGGDSAFEVYNGSRLFTYTHPRDDHEPATVTVTEMRAPDGYIGDPTPKTAVIHPTYTRITKVLTHTITITTTTTTTSVIDIDSGEVLSESSASADSETELNPPVVQEYTDFIEGDRETTLTFVNTPKPCSLTIYKYSKGNYSQALSGAKFRIRYADPNVSAQVWTLTTGPDGKIYIDLPHEGTLIVEELEAPAGHVIGQIYTWEVVVAKGEDKIIEISNDKKADIIVYKKDAQTGQLLAGAIIKATLIRAHTPPYDQNVSYTQTTGTDGKAVFSNMIPGEYRIEEQSPPQYYLGTSVVHNVSVFDGSNEPVTAVFENDPWTGLTIKKVDATDGHGLAGAVFKLYEGTAAETTKFLGDFQTNENGMVVIQNLESDKYYTIVEAQPPHGYFIDADNSTQTILIKPEAVDKNLNVIFRNMPKPKLLITKIDEATGNRLSGAVFRVAERGSAEYVEVTTGADGTVLLENLAEAWYQVTEIRSPSGYLLDFTVHDVELVAGETSKLVVNNSKKPTLTIRKVDELTGQGLSGAVLRITKEGAMEYQDVSTGANGVVTLTGFAPGWVTVVEQKAPNGYILDQTPHHIELKAGGNHDLVIKNRHKPSLKIVKLDSVTKQPLQYVTFSVACKNGKTLGEFTTDENGEITLTDIDPGLLVITETKARDGYIIADKEKEALAEWGKLTTVEFLNQPKNPLLIKKIDGKTGEPLSGAVFTVTKVNGEYVGEYTTGRNGFITVTGLEPGFFTVKETKSPAGYLLTGTPKTVQLKMNEPAVVEFENQPLYGLHIVKTDAVTREPLSGVEFKVTEMSGRLIGNYTTDMAGSIYVPELKEGWYSVTEVMALTGYKPDYAPRSVEVKAGEPCVAEFQNKPYPRLVIQKLDAGTLQPLEGVRFKLMDKYGREIGTFTTNVQGQIQLTGMDEGSYYCQEVEAKAGYVLDATVREVSLQWGKTTTLEVKNTPTGSLRIKKIDAVTKRPVPGTTFIVYDVKNNILGEYVSDDKGIVELPRSISAQKLKIKEVKAAPGYVLDEQPRTVEIKSGETTEIVWENQPELGRIQIVKKAAADNPVTRDKAGKPLAEAVFEVYDKSLNIVDTIVTDQNGVATTIDLPLGTYALRETEAPSGYYTDGAVFYAEIKKNADLVRFEVLNNPADISVTVEKRGNVEVIAGDEMKYDFANIANTGNISLDGFYWHDQLPTDAVRLKTVYTGTWNEKLTYSVTYKTNLKSGYKTLAANLSSQTSHMLDCSPAALKLSANEYVTDIRFEFGTVKSGFREETPPSFIVNTLATLPDGYRIVNHTDVSGKGGGAEVTAKDIWVTVALGKPKGCLPRTGL